MYAKRESTQFVWGKEVKKWQDEEALKRYQMIAPLLDEDLDEAKRRQLREEIEARYEISKRSLY